MITLDLPPKVEQVVSQQAHQAGVSLEHYLLQKIIELTEQPSHSDVLQFLKGKHLESFGHDPLVLQKSMRDE